MLKVHHTALAALTLPLLLAACGSASTPASSGELVSLTLNSGLTAPASTQGLTPQGLPSTGTTSAVTYIKVNVKDATGKALTFDGSNVYKVGGPQTFITLSNTDPTAKLLLPRGTYSFESIGKANATGAFLAYGQDNAIDLSPKTPSVNLTLHTLISPANSTLISKLPTAYVNTTDRLDLRLAVKTPTATLDVPLSDYTVTYSNTDATVLNSSKLGANVQVVGTTGQTTATVDALVNGYVATGTETATVQSQKVTYQVPLSLTGLGTDATPPTVTLNPVAASINTALTLSGTANDNKAISQVRVFDGSVLIGSTNADDVTAGAKLITFAGTTWSFNWTSGSAAPELTVVASDAAGNESRVVPQSGVTVVAWGANGSGPADLPAGLTNVTAIAAGNGFSLALKSDGTVVGWGTNGYGPANVPAGLANVTAIAAGTNYSLALKRDGTVVAWGTSGYGATSVPAGLTNVTAIAAGASYSLALKNDGTVVAWGINGAGQSSVPAGLTNVTAIAAGNGFSLALKDDGTVVAWGANGYGQTSVPAGLTNVKAISAATYSLALKNDGTVVAWGINGYGAASVPAGLTDVKAIAAGVMHGLALKNDGTVVAWGNNASGQTSVPAGLTNVTAIAVGDNYSLALRSGQ